MFADGVSVVKMSQKLRIFCDVGCHAYCSIDGTLGEQISVILLIMTWDILYWNAEFLSMYKSSGMNTLRQ